MASESKGNALSKVKLINPVKDGSSSSANKLNKGTFTVNKKKIECSNRGAGDLKQKSVVTVTKQEVKKTTAASSSKTTTKTNTVKVKTEKKVYTLPGQRYDPPEEREPLRIFYESLLKQIPSSEMAEVWMMEHGLLSPERAKKAHERKQRRLQQQRLGGTPIKSPVKREVSQSSQKPSSSKNGELKPKKRSLYYDEDDDFTLKPKKGREN
ncbi:hypothetical protein AMTRI_Chr05g57800 [Amborella trichopoda]|uniref:Uncharacterized protein n=1 Tax=Amborella trichopoda TaxID=13333 RepID=U5D430_AMBTC|nr:uncharacterized protein LOC18443374 [Amborella trichopoda]ERN15093.1 hypothetical protein AMTR_s00056p00067330 [Amborella trichopoda]|eukprot:XP_006853626.1 uncharacterized protein LOC18443374 [Amborella trichopoda]